MSSILDHTPKQRLQRASGKPPKSHYPSSIIYRFLVDTESSDHQDPNKSSKESIILHNNELLERVTLESNLMLPEANTLQLRKTPPRDPLKTLFDFPYK